MVGQINAVNDEVRTLHDVGDIEWMIPPVTGGRHSGLPSNVVRLRIKATEKEPVEKLYVQIGESFVDRLGWVVGDRIVLGFDRERRRLAFRRVPAGQKGWVFHRGYNKASANTTGTGTLEVRLSALAGDIGPAIKCLVIKGGEGGVVFDLPSESLCWLQGGFLLELSESKLYGV